MARRGRSPKKVVQAREAVMDRCVRVKYPEAVRELVRDVYEDFRVARVPRHLRAAVRSHAMSIARSRCIRLIDRGQFRGA